MINLSATHRCELFEAIAQQIWAHIKYNHAAGIDVPEIGITNDILACIRTNWYHTRNFGVWADRGLKEIDFGGDIDIFVETTKDRFVWYALQAKVLKKTGKYDRLSALHGGEYQWDKLQRLQALSGCYIKYLFYNGAENFSHTGRDKCNRQFDEEEFGCSIVDIDKVQDVALRIMEPAFRDFHPKLAQPWRVIVCCKHDILKHNTYTPEQVLSSVRKRTQIIGSPYILATASRGTINENNVNVINQVSDQVERNPMYQMVIRNTTSW